MLYRCGSVAIVGRPNVGKSTLLNRFLGQKIAIVSPKPETTRQRLLGILTLKEAQVLFVDTPGIYRGPKTLLAKHQIRQAQEALIGSDLLLLITEATAGVTDEDRQIVQIIKDFLKRGSPLDQKVPGQKVPGQKVPGQKVPGQKVPGRPDPFCVFLAINKVDRVKKELVLPQIEELSRAYPFREIFPISATVGTNVEELLAALKEVLPEGPPLYPPDQVTDRPVRELAKELIREKALIFTHEEVPHAVAVAIDEWRPGSPVAGVSPSGTSPIYVRATIYVERDSQKGIVIGRQGQLLKRIGQAARKEIEELTQGKVFLDLWVKVQPNWRRNPQFLKSLGYG